ncbi:MAG: SDR family NAD(P)-dependent oxidoreductase [Kofleriaceae bacterium]
MTERISVEGRVCIVTGSARGIGLAIAEQLGKLGGKVVINDVDATELDNAVAELRGKDIDAIGVAADVSSTAGGQSLTTAALERWGKVDVLVNNAGITRDAMFHSMTDEQWDGVLSTHVRALFACTQPVVRHLRERTKADPSYDGGSIICMSSTSGLGGNIGQCNYAAAKAAVLGFVLSLAKETERQRTRVNAVVPTAWTRLVAAIPEHVLLKHLGEDGLARMKARKPEHVAAVVCYLASTASAGITGQFVRASGTTVGLISHPRSAASRIDDQDLGPEAVARIMDELRPALQNLSGLGEL